MPTISSDSAISVVDMWCDGACRNNGGVNRDLPVLAGAGVYCPSAINRNDRRQHRALPWLATNPSEPGLTSNRAEIYAAIIALNSVYTVTGQEDVSGTKVRLRMDSSYVYKAMTTWRHTWETNKWKTSEGTEIKNFDLFWDLLDVHDALVEQGCSIEYILVPREENQEADDLANLGCDEAEQHYADGYSHDYP